MTSAPYRLPPEIEEHALDAHVSNAARAILVTQRLGWSLVDVRNLPTLGDCPFYPVVVRLIFQRRKAG
jgi:hypothetical protein